MDAVAAAVALLDSWECKDANGASTTIDKAKTCAPKANSGRRLAEDEDCDTNVWTNPKYLGDDKVATTAAGAVDAWYKMGEFYDAKTGKMTAGKEEEAKMYLRVINKDTESVGFAVDGPMVIGKYCPKMTSYEADALKLSTPNIRKAPKAPKVPEGVEMLDNTDAACEVITPADEEAGTLAVREKCSPGNCCGPSKKGEEVIKETCRKSD